MTNIFSSKPSVLAVVLSIVIILYHSPNFIIRVKLGYNPSTKQFYAIKVIKLNNENPKKEEFTEEIAILSSLNHPNIVKFIDFLENTECIKKDGSSYKVMAIVLELVPGGDLFEYIANSGRFSEQVARTYFKILLESTVLFSLHSVFEFDYADFLSQTLFAYFTHFFFLTLYFLLFVLKKYFSINIDIFELQVFFYLQSC